MPPSPFANPDQRDTLVTGKKAEELHCPGNLALEWLIVSLAGFVPSTSQGARQGGDCSENVRSGSFLSCHSECPSQEPLHSAQSTRADKQIFHFKKGICPLSRRMTFTLTKKFVLRVTTWPRKASRLASGTKPKTCYRDGLPWPICSFGSSRLSQLNSEIKKTQCLPF